MKIAFYIAAVLVLTLTFKTACKNKSAAAPIAKADTSRVVALYVDTLVPDIKHEVLYRIIQSTVNVDTATKDLSWKTDTLYYRPFVDTVRNPTTKMPVLDSAGKIKAELKYLFTPKSMIWDSNIIVDSALSRFKKYLPSLTDTTKKN